MNFPDDENLKEIGRVCVAFSELEMNFAIMLEVLTDGSSECGAIIASQLSLQKTINVVSALFLHRFPQSPNKDRFEGILTRSAAVEARRNTVIHSYYFVDDSSPNRETIRNKSTTKRFCGLKHQRQIITPAILRQLSDDLVAVAAQVAEFIILLLSDGTMRGKPGVT